MNKTKILALLSGCFLILFTTSTFAVDPAFFSPVQNDKSVQILGMIFGKYIGSINLHGSPMPLVSELFRLVNSVVLGLAGIIVSYVGIVATIHTAHEGQVMGKQWSSLWIPARSLCGVLFMVPTPTSGYSLIQITIMWCVLQGIGAADRVWEVVMNNLKQGITLSGNAGVILESFIKNDLEIANDPIKTSTYDPAATDSPLINYASENLVLRMFRSHVCLKAIKSIANNTAYLAPQTSSSDPITVAPNVVMFDASMVSGDKSDLIKQIIQSIKNNPEQLTANIITGAISNNIKRADLYYGLKPTSATVALAPEKMSPQNICGSLKITASISGAEITDLGLNAQGINDLLDAALASKINAMKQINEQLAIIAGKYVNSFNKGQKTDNLYITSEELKLIAKMFNEMQSVYINMVFIDSDTGLRVGRFSKKPNQIAQVIDRGLNDGWIVAGGYYWYLTRAITQAFLKTATESVGEYFGSIIPAQDFQSAFNGSISSDKPVQPKEYMLGIMKDISSSLWPRIKATVGNLQSNSKVTANRFDIPMMDLGDQHVNALLKPLADLQKKYARGFTDIITGGIDEKGMPTKDPLTAIMTLGVELMLSCEIAYIIMVGIMIGVSILMVALGTQILGWGLGGATANVTVVLSIIFTIISAFMAILWVIGASLGVYVPMVPYLMFSVSAIGWLILVVEAMVAAPIFALSLVLPSGEELGKLVTGIGILTGIVLRPMLMIIGFIMAIQVCKAIIYLINMGFVSAVPPMASMFSFFVVLGIYTGLVVALVNKSFALIHIIPDKVLRWAGIDAEETDVSAVKEAQQSGEKAAKTANKAGMEVGEKAHKFMTDKGKQLRQAQKDHKPDSGGSGSAGGDPTGSGGGSGGGAGSGGAAGAAGGAAGAAGGAGAAGAAAGV